MIVNQKTNYDCAVAAMAMFLNVSYEEVAGVLYDDLRQPETEGTTDENMIEVMEKFGTKTMQVNFVLRGVPAILTVPSLNVKNANHAVYWTGQYILDPQHGRANKKFYKMKPESISCINAFVDINNPIVALKIINSSLSKLEELKELWDGDKDTLEMLFRTAKRKIKKKYGKAS